MNKRDQAIRRAIHSHMHWIGQWKRKEGLSAIYVSPRGKICGYSEYCFDVNKHLDATVKKIIQAAAEGEER